MFGNNKNLIMEGFARRCCTCFCRYNGYARIHIAWASITVSWGERPWSLSQQWQRSDEAPSSCPPSLYFTLIHVTELATQPYLYTFHLVKYLLMSQAGGKQEGWRSTQHIQQTCKNSFPLISCDKACFSRSLTGLPRVFTLLVLWSCYNLQPHGQPHLTVMSSHRLSDHCITVSLTASLR